MAKNSSVRAAAAARAAEMRAEAARKDRQRKQIISAVVAVVVVIIAVLVGVVVANQPKEETPAASAGADAALTTLTTLPASTYDQAAAPTGRAIPEKLDDPTPVEQDGKPEVLYVGAEFCPYCGMERWALIGALSRFGTFEGLTPTTSGSDHSPSDIVTWSFVGSTYTSDHVAFSSVETQDREGAPLQTLEGQPAELFQKYNPGGGIPWVTYGGTYATNGATVDGSVFEGATYEELSAGLTDPTSDVGQAVLPTINALTAQICQQTGGQPADVCTSAGVMTATALLKQ